MLLPVYACVDGPLRSTWKTPSASSMRIEPPPDPRAKLAMPVSALMASDAQPPAGLSPPCPQFRKDCWLSQKPSFGRRLRRGQRFFRNWTQGDERNAGAYIPAGAPNITGRAEARTGGVDLASGCFSRGGTPGLITAGLSGTTNGFMFDASKSSSVYGGADTIMPPSINQPTVLYLGRPT